MLFLLVFKTYRKLIACFYWHRLSWCNFWSCGNTGFNASYLWIRGFVPWHICNSNLHLQVNCLGHISIVLTCCYLQLRYIKLSNFGKWCKVFVPWFSLNIQNNNFMWPIQMLVGFVSIASLWNMITSNSKSNVEMILNLLLLLSRVYFIFSVTSLNFFFLHSVRGGQTDHTGGLYPFIMNWIDNQRHWKVNFCFKCSHSNVDGAKCIRKSWRTHCEWVTLCFNSWHIINVTVKTNI